MPRKEDCGSFVPILRSLGPESECDEEAEEAEEDSGEDELLLSVRDDEDGAANAEDEVDESRALPTADAAREDRAQPTVGRSVDGSADLLASKPDGALGCGLITRRPAARSCAQQAHDASTSSAAQPPAHVSDEMMLLFSQACTPGPAGDRRASSSRDVTVRAQLASLFHHDRYDVCTSLFDASQLAVHTGDVPYESDLAMRLGMLDMQTWERTDLGSEQHAAAGSQSEKSFDTLQLTETSATRSVCACATVEPADGSRPVHRRTNSDPPAGLSSYTLWGACPQGDLTTRAGSVWGPSTSSPSKSWGGFASVNAATPALPCVSASLPNALPLQPGAQGGACVPSTFILQRVGLVRPSPFESLVNRTYKGDTMDQRPTGASVALPHRLGASQYAAPAGSLLSSTNDAALAALTRSPSDGVQHQGPLYGHDTSLSSKAGSLVLPPVGRNPLSAVHMHSLVQLPPPPPHAPFQMQQHQLCSGPSLHAASDRYLQSTQPPLPQLGANLHSLHLLSPVQLQQTHLPHACVSHHPQHPTIAENIMASHSTLPPGAPCHAMSASKRSELVGTPPTPLTTPAVPATAVPLIVEAGTSRAAAVSCCATAVPDAHESRHSKELTMSPRTRALYKDFSHALRSKETQSKGIRFAKQLATRCIAELPQSVHWRVHLEMADLAKREKNFSDARSLYRMAAELQPTAPQAWLEYAKMEEERGHFGRCQRILTHGLQNCPHHEALMLKGIKHLERMGDLPTARSLLSQLQCVPINQSWRTMLEGALLEARAGQTHMARRVFKFLLTSAPWYGPVWYEACRFEQRCNHLREALRVAEEGLRQLPRYGPLWFCALRLLECVTPQGDVMAATRAHVERGVRHISKDLVWKLWFESAQVEERNGQLLRSRAAYAKSVATCAPNLRWKVWLGGARTELSHANFDVSQALLQRALEESPPKTRAIVMLEQSRLHELHGDINSARKLLRAARHSSRSEWKVFLESLLLELRAESTDRALREARRALEVHRGTGRLWAVLIQLEQPAGIRTQLRVFQQALLEVPKSGEVWCEGARICLNPFSDCFSLEAAHSFLDFAIEFTPQYGDSFIEYLRLQVRARLPHGLQVRRPIHALSSSRHPCVSRCCLALQRPRLSVFGSFASTLSPTMVRYGFTARVPFCSPQGKSLKRPRTCLSVRSKNTRTFIKPQSVELPRQASDLPRSLRSQQP